MKIDSTNNINFRGYKNVIHNVFETKTGKEGFLYMSMQLDNTKRNDLKIWQNIQKNLLNRTAPKDTITFAIFTFNGIPNFILSNFLLKVPEDQKSTPFENYVLKAFTLIAKLASDIKNKMPIVYDKDFSKTLLEAKEDLIPIFENDADFVDKMMLDGITPWVEHIKPAKIITQKID